MRHPWISSVRNEEKKARPRDEGIVLIGSTRRTALRVRIEAGIVRRLELAVDPRRDHLPGLVARHICHMRNGRCALRVGSQQYAHWSRERTR